MNRKLNTARLFQTTLALLFVATANATPTLAIPAKTLSVESGKVQFLAVGKPSFLKVNGEGNAPTGTMTIENGKATGEFSFDLGTLDTENETRTGHMKDKYLEVEKFPKATIKFKDVDAPGDKVKASIPAELTLHGQTRTITMNAELSDGEKRTANGNFKIKLSDFGIAIPSYAGVTIADEVTVTIDSLLK